MSRRQYVRDREGKKHHEDGRLVVVQTHADPSLRALVSSRTIKRHLAAGHLVSWCPSRVLPITPTKSITLVCLEWCRALRDWTATEWNQDVFSDESRFNLKSDDYRVRVWRPTDKNINPAFALQRHTTPPACVMTHVLRLMIELPRAISKQDNARPPLRGCHKIASAKLPPFTDLLDPQMCRN
ncbi:transposable element Tcb2 transposase [Trichonephila clavipes]|nr:transposable element Tcb2 transposase [Trichonephila clavipes]